jgi:hypothetical protein
VVLLAVSDSLLPLATAPNHKLAVLLARRWISLPSADLHRVLDYAGICPDAWHDHVVPQLRRQWALADAGLEVPRRYGRQPAAESRQDAIRPRGASGQPDAGIGHPGGP